MKKDLNYFKRMVETSFEKQGEEVPDGFCISYNEKTWNIKVFLNLDSFNSLGEKEDVVVAMWVDGKWKEDLK